jgi:histone acetyltransferase (RNA polymerase elongator complex component)
MGCASPLIVPVFIPHSGCPHRCVFCNQESITGMRAQALCLPRIRTGIDTFLDGCRKTIRHVQLAFYGGNFLGLPAGDVRALLEMATEYINSRRINGIRFSTRPDTIDPERMDLIRNYPIDVVELGVQSMDDTVLALSRRGHTAGDSETAVALLKAQGFQIGLQLMIGLPGDDEDRSMETAQRVAALSPDFVRIYPAVVLKGSPLAQSFEHGNYTPWSLSRSVSTVKRMLLLFQKKKIRVIRMGLQATTELDNKDVILAGPYHPAFGHLVWSEVYFDRAVAAITAAGMAEKQMQGRSVEIRISPRCVPCMRGYKNSNIHMLREMFALADVAVIPDPSMEEGLVAVTDRTYINSPFP